MRRPLVIGNWKMHGSRSSVAELLDSLLGVLTERGNAEVVVCPPFVFIPLVQEKLRGSQIGCGAQNVSNRGEGAYTGEVSAGMLRDFGCHYVLVGHSERRSLNGESSALVAEKFLRVRDTGMVPILCVGETLEQREAGLTLDVIDEQLDAVIKVAGIEGFAQGVVAYEPVWAIGTGRTATPQQAQEVHLSIRNRMARLSEEAAESLRIVYGGSVKAENAGELFQQTDIDGGLVGGASLKADEFAAIYRAAG